MYPSLLNPHAPLSSPAPQVPLRIHDICMRRQRALNLPCAVATCIHSRICSTDSTCPSQAVKWRQPRLPFDFALPYTTFPQSRRCQSKQNVSLQVGPFARSGARLTNLSAIVSHFPFPFSGFSDFFTATATATATKTIKKLSGLNVFVIMY